MGNIAGAGWRRSTTRRVRALATHLACAALTLVPAGALRADLVWYSGDPFVQGTIYGLGYGGAMGDSLMYQQFDLASATTISGLFVQLASAPAGQNFMWEIRQGMAIGNAGTLVASGASAGSGVASGFNPPFFGSGVQFTLSGLSLDLTPGTYWLSLARQGAYSSTFTTSGTNSVGSPGGSGTSLVHFPNGNNFYVSGQSVSYGIIGTPLAVPEVGSLALVGGVAAGACAYARAVRRFRRA